MISAGIFICNDDEIDQAERLDIPVPEIQLDKLNIGFDFRDVKMYHHTVDGGLILYIGGYKPENSWKMEKNDALIKALESRFNGVN